MDVGSTNATNSTSSAATSIASTAVASRASKTSNNKSFDEEMKNSQSQDVENEAKTEEKTSQKTEKTQEKNNDKGIENKNLIKDNKQQENMEVETESVKTDLLSMNIQQLLDTQNQMLNKGEMYNLRIDRNVDLRQNIGDTLNYNVINMNENDAIFFANIVQNNEIGLQNVAVDIKNALEFGTESIQKSAHVSKTLLNALQNTVKTGQAVRIDFGNDVAVIMRVSRDGSIMANFIPGDKAVEQYLKNNIDFLRQRFDEENISYSQLSYSQHQQQRERQQQDKEDRQ